MANYFTAILGSGNVAALSLQPVNRGDAYVYLRVSGIENFIIRPSEKVTAMVAPYATPLSSGVATTLLRQTNPNNNVDNGYFFFNGGHNTTQLDDGLSYSDLKIPTQWENTEFNIYWLQTFGGTEAYGNNLTPVYTYPHNLQPGEIVISGNLTTNDVMSYSILLDGIANDDDTNYGIPPADGPYAINVTYKYPSDPVIDVSGFSDWIYYGSGVISSGISFDLPFHDPRDSFKNVPAIYDFHLAYISASTDKPGSKPLVVTLNHANLIDSSQYYKNLDKVVFSRADERKLRRVGEVAIPPGTIDRKRISVGINDIAIKDNTYVKKGTYVSPYYPLDFQLYTFSFKVKESIPSYGDLNPYDLVKYYLEFNNNTWERISPLERDAEYEDGILVPKMFVFDQSSSETGSENVKFLNYGSSINVFRVKITFDLTAVTDSKFPPPEINDYTCVMFDKGQFLNL